MTPEKRQRELAAWHAEWGLAGYYSTWRTDTFTCDCGWTGVGRALAVEPFRDLFEIHCPRCDSRFATISYPDQVETAEAAAQGNVEAIHELPKFSAYEQTQMELALSRQQIPALPDFEGDELTFTFAIEGGQSLNPDSLLLLHDGVEIYRERSSFEWWGSIPELCTLLLERFPGRIAWIDPTGDARALLGDDMSASGKIRTVLAENHISPPTGEWVARD